jgi:C-terminal processing protease CtpA/Prc/tricorn protease-like protein
MWRYTLLTLSLICGALWAQEQSITFIPQAALHPQGTSMAFSYQGDIWILNFASNIPQRLTLHEAYETNPVFSADGKKIAFSGNRYGNYDVFSVGTNGGAPERKTFHSANDRVSDWTAKGELLFTTNRAFQQVEWDDEIYRLPKDVKTPQRHLEALGEMAVQSPSGRYIAFVRGACRVTRENYQGPANKEIWVYDQTNNSYTQITQNQVNDFLPRFKNEETLYFLSSINGRYGIVEKSINSNSQPKVVVHDVKQGIHFFDYASNKILYAKGLRWYKKQLGEKAEAITFKIPTDYRFYPQEKKTYRNNISGFSVSPSGKYAAIQIRGEIFVTEVDDEESRTINVSNHPYYDREPVWLNDSTLLYTSDREEGTYNFYKVTSADDQKLQIFESLKRKQSLLLDGAGDLRQATLSPNGKKLAFVSKDSKLQVATLEKGKLSHIKTLLNDWHGASGLAWSPDSRYLAYNYRNLNFNSEVYIQAVEQEMKPVNISMHPGSDYSPFWSPDGSKLGFISTRNNRDADIWFVWLTEEDWLKSEKEREEGYYFDEPEEEEENEEGADAKKKEVKPLQIDFENIYDRLQQVTSLNGNEGNLLISKDGETFYFTSYNALTKGSDLFSVKYNRSDLEQITKGGISPRGLTWDKDQKGMYYVSKGKLYHLDPSKGKPTQYPHEAKMTLNKVEERKQVFDEAWKVLNQKFYDPDFHGHDWEALKKQYRPWALAASTEQDFRFVFNTMLGQLNASHMGIYGGSPEELQKQRTGLLGLEVKPVSQGVEITRVIPRSPATRLKSSLQVGEIVTHLNGKAVADENFYGLLADAAEEPILLEINGPKGQREVVIRPTRSLSTELYEEWVAERKRLTEKYSKGKLGYIHIKSMNKTSFERFERELMASGYGKEGIVIDVRFNGGGWTTDYLMAVLNVRQHAYTVPRGATDNLAKNHPKFSDYYPYSERLPLAGWTKPSVALCNESSYSNAEIFSHAYKSLDIGTLVGQPTFGAVISTGAERLLDGSRVRLPFRGWYVKGTGQNMENGPAVPDILVQNLPTSKSSGEDPQLQKAVETLLQQIESE